MQQLIGDIRVELREFAGECNHGGVCSARRLARRLRQEAHHSDVHAVHDRVIAIRHRLVESVQVQLAISHHLVVAREDIGE